MRSSFCTVPATTKEITQIHENPFNVREEREREEEKRKRGATLNWKRFIHKLAALNVGQNTLPKTLQFFKQLIF
jgi:hypothetical protein